MTTAGWNPVKMLWISLWLILWSLGILGGAGARAQQDPGAPAPDPRGAYVWTGWDGERFQMMDATSLRDELLKDLSALQLGVEAERDFQGALAALTEIWKRAAWVTPYNGQWEALVRTAELRTRLLIQLGRFMEAERSVNELLIDLDLAGLEFDVHALTLATSDRVEAEARHLKDPRLVALRDEIGRRLGRAPSGESASADPILQEVSQAVARGDAKLIETLGKAAVPALLTLLEGNRGAVIPEYGKDPLNYLVQLDERRAASYLLKNLDGHYLWRRRMLRAMKEGNVLVSPGSWGRAPGGEQVLEPDWLNVLEDLAVDPQLTGDALEVISGYWGRAPLPPVLEQVVMDALHSSDPKIASRAAKLVMGTARQSALLPIVETLLEDPSPNLRQRAASWLAGWVEPTALLEHADDPDPAVRRAVTDWLEKRIQQEKNRALDERELAAWRTLAGDADPALRFKAALAIMRSKPAAMPPIEFFAPLVRDPDPAVRAQTIFISPHPDTEGADGLLLELAGDSDLSVQAAVDSLLSHKNLTSQRALPLVRARWENRAGPLWRDAEYRLIRDVMRIIAEAPEGVHAIARWYVASESGAQAAALQTLDENGRRPVQGLVEALRQRDKVTIPILLELPQEELADFVLALARASGPMASHVEEPLLDEVLEHMDKDPEAWVVAARRIERGAPSLLVQARALKLMVRGGDQEAPARVLEFLRDPRWSETELSNDLLRVVRNISYFLPDGVRNETLLEAVRDERCADTPTSEMARPASFPNEPGPDLSVAILERWFGSTTPPMSQAVSGALVGAAHSPERLDPDLLSRAVRIEEYCESAVTAMGVLLDPRYLPLLGDCIVGDWLRPSGHRNTMRDNAVRAITRYFSDEAAEVLLEAVKRPIPEETRNQCFEALEKIRRYQDARETLASRRVESRVREQAIGRLVPMLASPDAEVRTLAVQSLATLEAVEFLPDLIGMLGDADVGVQAAVRAAIARLTAEPEGD